MEGLSLKLATQTTGPQVLIPPAVFSERADLNRLAFATHGHTHLCHLFN